MIALFPSMAWAQEQAGWTLTVYLQAKFGWSKVYVEADGPFGVTQSGWFATGVGAYATLQLPSSDFPAGYTYKIGISGPGLTDLTEWFAATSTGQDQTFTYVYNDPGSGADQLIGPQ